MKKLLNFLILGFVLALFTNASCTEPDPPIPTGDHTFSYRINGELFLPQGSGGGWSSLPAGAGLYFNEYNSNLSYSVSASNSKYRGYFGIYNWNLVELNVQEVQEVEGGWIEFLWHIGFHYHIGYEDTISDQVY